MQEQIYFDRKNYREYKKELERQRIENYVVQPPIRSSAGKTPAMFDEMANTMCELYQQVQELIAAANEMLANMADKLTDADEKSAPM